MGLIVSLLLISENGFGIKYPTKINRPLDKESQIKLKSAAYEECGRIILTISYFLRFVRQELKMKVIAFLLLYLKTFLYQHLVERCYLSNTLISTN